MATQNAINTGKPIEVSNGGIGVASSTAYAVITGGTTSTGALQNTGTGSSGQVLTSAGSSSLPTWGTSSGTGALVLIQTQTVSGTPSSIDFTSGITSTYNNYLVLVSNYLPSTDASSLRLKYSTDGGSTYVATNYLTGICFFPYNSSTITNHNSTVGFFAFPLASSTSGRGNDAVIWLFNMTSGTGNIGYCAQGASYDTTPVSHGMFYETGIQSTASQTANAITFVPSSGTMASGQFSLYGIAQ